MINFLLLKNQGITCKIPNNHHIFIIIYILLILNITSLINKYIYIEKFITKLVSYKIIQNSKVDVFAHPPEKTRL
ncbi:hypothetical protein CN271_30435 [Bacillus cereus]|nr:hypothetical protein CON59_32280 [Bacillus cereus]PET33205.1 hypothetical protein CN523_32045 [Bacillus cereus]PEV74930.1 hypothetical protein CN429_23000 [Bacillus cereus]PFA37219.1 hypothetical protein CN389_31470 [Bacillus cereus]PFD57459.1 hypothetical protein CN271_30435 [Bacillus cereus]